MNHITDSQQAMAILAQTGLVGIYYTGRTNDPPGIIWRGLSLKERVSLQMRHHIKTMNLADGLNMVPKFAKSQCDFEALS